jgi:hypothetical protein
MAKTQKNQEEKEIIVLYLPSLGSHLTIWLPVSKQEKVMSATEFLFHGVPLFRRR